MLGLNDAWTSILSPNDIVTLLVIFLLGFFGSIGKDYLRMFSFHQHMSLSRVLLSTVTSTIFIFAVSDVVIEYSGIKGLMCVSFIFGLLGFEVLQRISTIGGLFRFIVNMVQTYVSIRETLNQTKNTHTNLENDTMSDETNNNTEEQDDRNGHNQQDPNQDQEQNQDHDQRQE